MLDIIMILLLDDHRTKNEDCPSVFLLRCCAEVSVSWCREVARKNYSQPGRMALRVQHTTELTILKKEATVAMA
jgi:hypothetical protein